MKMPTLLKGTPSENSNPSESDYLATKANADYLKSIAEFVNSEYEKCKKSRQSLEREWLHNFTFYLGNQYVVWGKGPLNQGKLNTPGVAPWRTRLVVNRIKPIIRTELSRVTSQKPNASVVPASSEDEDLFAAQAAEQIWESIYVEKKIFRTFTQSAFWMLITGVGFTKDYWDPSKTDKRYNAKGDLCIENVTPFHIFVPDQSVVELEEQPYVIHAKVVPVDKARRMFPDMTIKPTVIAHDEILDSTKMQINTDANPDSCLMLEMWLKPGAHKDFPEGGLLTVLDDKVVVFHNEGLPYDHGEFPFTKWDHIPTGKFYSDSVITDLRSLQREYNRTRSQIIEAKNRMAKPQLTAVEGSVDARKITSEPGQVIFYKAGFNPPQPLPLQPIPAYVMQELDRIIMDMEDISAQHQVSKGNTPPGVTAATAIGYLQERDDSVLSHTYMSVEQGMEKLARHVLSHVVQYWDVERTVRVTGIDGSFDALTLKGADIKNGTDIRMEAGSALPVSKAARQALLMDLMKMGFIDPNKGLELMEVGGVQKLYEQLKIDERQAQRENSRMKNMDEQAIAEHNQMVQQYEQMQQMVDGMVEQQQSIIPPELSELAQPTDEPGNLPFASGAPDVQMPGMEIDPSTGQELMPPSLVPVNTWDNHAVHIDVHNRFRKGQAFELLSEDHKILFEDHVRMHADALNASAMAVEQSGGMGVPPLSQGEGGQPPAEEDIAALMGENPNG